MIQKKSVQDMFLQRKCKELDKNLDLYLHTQSEYKKQGKTSLLINDKIHQIEQEQLKLGCKK